MMTFDPVAGVTVLFGGQGAGAFNDTWLWDGTSWTSVVPAVSPAARSLGAMAYDLARQRAVLFGGTGAAGNNNETWEFDGTTWAQVLTTNSPPVRQRHGLAFDSVRNVTVLFAGSAGTTRYNDVWEYDGADWTPIAAAASPVVRDRAAVAFDPVRARTVVFGGRGPTSSANLSDTWEWSGTDWRQRGVVVQPTARSGASLAFDDGNAVTLLFGGLGAAARLQDLWQWDGAQWAQLTAVTLPPARNNHALAFDGVRRRAVLFGGVDATSTELADTWEWDGSNWLLQNPATSPVPRSAHAMVFDPVQARVLLFGGRYSLATADLNDTWQWDGTQWLSLTPAQSPTGRSGHALAYDGGRMRTVLFGGLDASGALGDTWEWDGSQWNQSLPGSSPPARSKHGMSYDAQRGTTVLFGGADTGAALLADVWEWDGTTWTPDALTGPSARSQSAMAYDALRRRHVVFGGATATAVNGEAWELGVSGGADVTPFASGCPGSLGVPLLAANSAPSLGNAGFGLDASLLPANALTFLGLSFGRTLTDLGPACALYLGAPVILVSTGANGGGVASYALPIPNVPSLAGVRLFAQAADIDVGGAYLGAFAFTRGLDLRLGQ
jgi:hypothetical protein